MEIFNPGELYTIDEVAEKLKVHPQTIRIKIREGELVSVDISNTNEQRRTLRLEGEEVNKYLKRRQAGGMSR